MAWQGFGVGGGGGWLVSCGILQGALEGENDVEATPRALQGPGVSTGNLRTPTASDPRRMYSSQWGVLISIDVGSSLPPDCSSPHPLRTAEPDLLQRREKKATSPHAVNVLVLHLPTQCSQGQEMPSALKGRRWGNPGRWSRRKCLRPMWSLFMVKTALTIALYLVCESLFLFFFLFNIFLFRLVPS